MAALQFGSSSQQNQLKCQTCRSCRENITNVPDSVSLEERKVVVNTHPYTKKKDGRMAASLKHAFHGVYNLFLMHKAGKFLRRARWV